MSEGKLVIFTAPSGAGKTTIVKHLLKVRNDLAFSISATTRAQRSNETDGKDYYFISTERFLQQVENGDFLEWQEVYENQFYGTLKSEVQRLWNDGKNVIFDVDVKGAVNIKKAFHAQALAVFVRPPSKEVLFERLRARRTEDEQSLQKRIARAGEELNYEDRFDVTLVNDELPKALAEAEILVDNFLKGS